MIIEYMLIFSAVVHIFRKSSILKILSQIQSLDLTTAVRIRSWYWTNTTRACCCFFLLCHQLVLLRLKVVYDCLKLHRIQATSQKWQNKAPSTSYNSIRNCFARSFTVTFGNEPLFFNFFFLRLVVNFLP